MGIFGESKARSTAAARVEVLELRAQAEALQLDEMREQVQEGDVDRRLLVAALKALKPGQGPKELGRALLDLCLGPFDLYTYYVAIADYETDLISFPFYFEGGKPRNLMPERLSSFDGLTTKAMAAREVRYYGDLDSQVAVGAVFTEAERITGLIPQTWFGVPLGVGEGWEGPPFGLLSFQSFKPDAYSEARRSLMISLGRILALALKADPDRRLGSVEA